MIWVGLVLKTGTTSNTGDNSDIIFTEAEDSASAASNIQNHTWSRPWGKKDESKLVILKLVPLDDVPKSNMVEPLSYILKPIKENVEVTKRVRSKKTVFRLRRK